MTKLHFEDFEPGSTAHYGGVTVDSDAMLAYAREFDAQPMHLSDSAAAETMAGKLIASGWFTAALNMRMIAEDFVLRTASMGSPGVSELKWSKPVHAGDVLTGVRHVLDRRPSLSKPDRGFVNFRFVVSNQRGETVLDQTNLIMVARRGRAALPDAATRPFVNDKVDLPEFTDVRHDTIPFYEDLVIGERLDLGALAFPEHDVIRFARAFDPQYFHVDPNAAKGSLFGGLIASGWHTAAGWMGCMVRNRTQAAMGAMARGERPARLGPSPGFTQLRWIKPVFAGDTIRYTSAIIGKRVSASRPEWGLVRHFNTGVNQHGDVVFSFHGNVFWERRKR
jgi:acyl dehydratase